MRRRVVDRTFDSDMGSTGSDGSGKERLKWTLELHDLFEMAVNQLGGPDRATPKGILKAMGIPALTIYHVKSHLQYGYEYLYWYNTGGKFERRNISEMMPNFSTTSGAQLNEALQMQKEVESQLSDQLEIQRSLKLKIEAQARFLQGIAEDFKNRAIISKHGKAFSPISPPSLCEESDSFGKEFESGSEIDKAEITSEEEYRAPKRLRIEENVLMSRYMVPSLNSESFNQSMLLQHGARARYSAYETHFPWSVATYKSPLMPSLYYPYNY
ncbi:hypothetical protein TEA_000461 [Camellia sinensis var. sinensis]|uniref:HTH myb-type domain-containing protein n=1 Tax=Camellia sinensis var. sinensis TaxID=542762 RepID=A0A4S4E872_CAMSN|nr:hypothetical protein TEA_000461 [Camellia sinensis var. sinensis]